MVTTQFQPMETAGTLPGTARVTGGLHPRPPGAGETPGSRVRMGRNVGMAGLSNIRGVSPSSSVQLGVRTSAQLSRLGGMRCLFTRVCPPARAGVAAS